MTTTKTKQQFYPGARVLIEAPRDVNHGKLGTVRPPTPAEYGNVGVDIDGEERPGLFQPSQLVLLPIRKARYEVGDIVRLIPDPANPDGGPHPDDFNMPAPLVKITNVITHTYNPEGVMEYVVRYLTDDDFDGDEVETIKPGKIARLVLDGALLRRVLRAVAFDHMLRDPYAHRDDRWDSIVYEVRDRLYFARRRREERQSRHSLAIPECLPWSRIEIKKVEEIRDGKHFASVEVVYGVEGMARAIYGVSTDGHVYCWAD